MPHIDMTCLLLQVAGTGASGGFKQGKDSVDIHQVVGHLTRHYTIYKCTIRYICMI